MKPIARDELLGYEEYERGRDAFRARIIELKRRRRVSVGELVTVIFENRDTLQFQIQEMLRVERIVDPAKIEEELDVYNALLPADGELSATLFIEITDAARLQADLDRLKGIDGERTLALRVGTESVYGVFESGRSREDRISAVHFVKFRPHDKWVTALEDPAQPAALELHHPRYRRSTVVSPDVRAEWLADLGH